MYTQINIYVCVRHHPGHFTVISLIFIILSDIIPILELRQLMLRDVAAQGHTVSK